jgi:RNA polymerase sporulation-specific sigma factor
VNAEPWTEENKVLDEKNAAPNDDALLRKSRAGDTAALDQLLHRYKDLVKSKSRLYFIMGADRDDIVQEGMIGLYKAIRDYDPERPAGFASFAELCVTRQILTAIKAAARQKHIPLNSYISLDKTVDGETEQTYMELLTGTQSSPEEALIDREDRSYIEVNIEKSLSELECRVLSLHLVGKSYAEIAVLVARDEKAVDNALQRVRRKVEKILSTKKG